jgi:hypothetical protein
LEITAGMADVDDFVAAAEFPAYRLSKCAGGTNKDDFHANLPSSRKLG